MSETNKLLRRNRFFLEILGIVVLGEFLVMCALNYWTPAFTDWPTNLLDAVLLTCLVAPFIFWRSRVVHGREWQQLSEAVQHSTTAVLLLDVEGRITWLNQGFAKMTGYSLEEATGKTAAELIRSDQSDQAALELLDRSFKQRMGCQVKLVNRRKDGQMYHVAVELRPEIDRHGELLGFIEFCTDISELKETQLRLEASLRESGALHHTVHTHAIVSVADRRGRITDVNLAFCDISGYSREQLLGQDHNILNSGVHPPEFWQSMWADISSGKPWRGEICNRNRQGQLYWVESMIAPFIGADGHVEKYVSIRLDITARMAFKAELERKSQLLAEVVEASPYGLAVYDEKQVLQLHNAQFRKILNLPEELLANKPFLFADQVHYLYARGDFGGEHSAETLLQRFQASIAARKEWTVERRQYDDRYIEMRGYAISAGWTVLSYRDNTERNQRKLNLLDTQERVRLATASAGIGIWSLNLITGEQIWDEQQYRLFGLDLATHANRKIYDLWSEHLHPDDAEEARETFQHSLNNGVAFDHVFRIIRGDGSLRYIKAMGSPRLDAEGRVEYIVGTNMDITDTTLLAESMRTARDQAEEAANIKSQFMTNMSHEMRTPMNAVLGMLKLLGTSDLDPSQRSFLDQTERAARLMVRMIDEVLQHAQLSSSIVYLSPTLFPLEELLRALADQANTSIESKDINVLFDLDPSLPATLYGDRQRLQQVLVNLLTNAIKFTSQGVVVIRISLEDQGTERKHLRFCVQDTGVGVEPAFRERIFQEFTQVNSTTTRAFGGVGLGLSISQRLVKIMGGNITLVSEPGVGSSFSFVLDLLPDDASCVRLADCSNPAYRPNALVLDACQTSLGLINAMAQSLQWHAYGTHSAEKALAEVRSGLASNGRAFTALLLDWNLPATDMRLLVQQVRSLYHTAHQKQPNILLLSNNRDPRHHQRILEMSDLIDGSLAKPFSPGMLQEALEKVQSGARQVVDSVAVPVAAKAPAQSDRPQRLKGLRVLSVDDTPINQSLIQKLLTREGAEVSLAGNGRQGVDAALSAPKGQGFDVVLMDIQMPIMDGYEATRMIRVVPHLSRLPIIAVTANVLESDLAKCLAAGMNHHVGKPYEIEELVKAICIVTQRPVTAAQTLAAVAHTSTYAANPEDTETEPMHVYWLQSKPERPLPDTADLQLQGVLLQELDSVEALAALDAKGTPPGLLIVEHAVAISPALQSLVTRGNGASMPAMQMIALADAATEDDMLACHRAGIVDLLPIHYALNHLPEICQRHLAPSGERHADVSAREPIIDSRRAMEQMQSDAAFFGSLLQALFEELPTRTKQLRDCWFSNPKQVKHLAHSLKGLALSLGLRHLATLTALTETLSTQEAKLEADLLADLEGELQSTGFQIVRWLQMNQEAMERPS